MKIFRDESGWRFFWTRFVVKSSVIVILALTAAIALLVLKRPELPQFGHAIQVPELTGTSTGDRGPRVGRPLARGWRAASTSRPTLRYAFHSPSEERSFTSLQKNAAELDGIFMDWMEIDPKGGVRRQGREEQSRTLRWVSRYAPELQKYAILVSSQPAPSFARLVATTKVARSHVAQIVTDLQSAGFNGLMLHFEGEIVKTRAFAVFLDMLKQELSRCGCKLVLLAPTSVELKYLVPNLRKADLVVLRTYFSSAGFGSVPTQDEFEQQLEEARKLIPAEKLIVGIGSYATLANEDGEKQLTSVYHSWYLSDTSGAPLTLDRNLVGRFRFTREDGKKVDVRVLDGVTAFNHMRAALSRRPAGVALWRLGIEDTSVWQALGKGKFPDSRALRGLRTLEGMSDLTGQIEGAIFAVEAVGTAGSRHLDFDASRGLIIAQRLIRAPVSYRASNWVRQTEKLVALSFDDGPDPKYTPRILDILKEKSARATFFVTGAKALTHPSLLRRIYDEGHDIGNHTFSHPDLANRSGFEIDLELNATQRTLEKVLNVRTRLFRAPYSSVAFETSPEGLRVLARAGELGYVSLRVTVDPYDWANPTSEMIVDRVMSTIVADQPSNIVILLHDSGGDRTHTIEALPIIIDQLKQSGHRFVAAHELMEGGPEVFMPRATTPEQEPQTLAVLSGVGVDFYTWIVTALPPVAMVTIVLCLFRSVFVCVFACRHARIHRRRRSKSWQPSVCVVIPAYNEEKVILKTIESVRAGNYPGLEIIVVDDGSSDNTFSVVKGAYTNGEVKVFRVPNAGKASALNSGIERAQAEIVVAIDADTVLAPNAVERLVRHFEDERVGAVAGKAVVGNETSTIGKFQSLEYITSQNLDRRAFELFNAISVVPGAIGAWRRAALLSVGGFREDTLAEDADATVSLERKGYRVLYEPDAVAFTEAPETVKAFLKQRFRWMFGTLQMAFKHRAALLNGEARGVGLIALPNIVIFQIGFTLLAPIFDLVLIINVFSMTFGYVIGDEVAGNVWTLTIYWMAFQFVDAALLALVARLEGGGVFWRMLPYLIIQRFFYRQLLYIVAVKTLFAAVAGTFVGWGKLVRTGNVAARAA